MGGDHEGRKPMDGGSPCIAEAYGWQRPMDQESPWMWEVPGWWKTVNGMGSLIGRALHGSPCLAGLGPKQNEYHGLETEQNVYHGPRSVLGGPRLKHNILGLLSCALSPTFSLP